MTAARMAYGAQFKCPSGTPRRDPVLPPSDESLGYYQMPLRGKRLRQRSRKLFSGLTTIVAMFGLAFTVGAATAQTIRDTSLPLPAMVDRSVVPAAWAPPSPPTASAPSGTRPANSLRDKLRSAASRMRAEELPPPNVNGDAVPQGPGPAPSEPRSPRTPIRIPLGSPVPADRVEIKQSGDKVSLSVRETPLNRLLVLMGQQLGVNIVCADNLTTPVSVSLEQVPLEDALSAVCSTAGACWALNNGIVHVSSLNATAKLPAEIQGRQVRVFRLDYIAAKDIETAIKPMLSPVGQSFVTETKTQDNRRTQETVAVQDLPSYLRTIEQYVAELDRRPRQVLIEAHVLAIDLNSDLVHGVNFKHLFAHLAQANLTVQGFAANAPQAFLFTFDGSHLDTLVQALRTQSAAKTLASPKVLVLNGQEARMQVGRQDGYRVQTTTETSTMESVNFLETGVILRVTPRISADNQILMHVKPEVSDGEVDAKTELPNSKTTEVETDVILPDGRGMVIGGLIDEKDIEEQQKVPVLGDVWLVGRIFQRRKVTRQRREIIICLVPRIVPDQLACDDRHEFEVMRTQTPLVTPNLQRYPRPWEATLPDAVEKPFRVKNHLPGSKHGGAASGEDQPLPYGCPVETIPYYSGELPAEIAPLPSSPPDQSAQEPRQEPIRQTMHKTVTYPEPRNQR